MKHLMEVVFTDLGAGLCRGRNEIQVRAEEG